MCTPDFDTNETTAANIVWSYIREQPFMFTVKLFDDDPKFEQELHAQKGKQPARSRAKHLKKQYYAPRARINPPFHNRRR